MGVWRIIKTVQEMTQDNTETLENQLFPKSKDGEHGEESLHRHQCLGEQRLHDSSGSYAPNPTLKCLALSNIPSTMTVQREYFRRLKGLAVASAGLERVEKYSFLFCEMQT